MPKRRKRSREFKKREREQRNEAARLAEAEEAREERRKKRAEQLAREREDEMEKEQKRIEKKKQREQMKRRARLYFLVLLVVAGVAAFSAWTLISVREQRREVKAENEALLEQKERLSQELDSVESDEYVEQEARAVLRMTKPGEVLYILPESGDEIEDYGSLLWSLSGAETKRIMVTMPDGTVMQGGAVGFSPIG